MLLFAKRQTSLLLYAKRAGPARFYSLSAQLNRSRREFKALSNNHRVEIHSKTIHFSLRELKPDWSGSLDGRGRGRVKKTVTSRSDSDEAISLYSTLQAGLTPGILHFLTETNLALVALWVRDAAPFSPKASI